MAYLNITKPLRLKPMETADYIEAIPWYKNKKILWYSENLSEGIYWNTHRSFK